MAQGGLVLAAALWLAAVVATPWLAARGSSLSPLLYEIFGRVCHQIPERSFHWLGHPLAVCHRCTGLYAGGLVGLVMASLADPWRDWLLAHPRVVPVMAIPLLLDWTIWGHSPGLRFATGVLAAAPTAVLLWAAVRQLAGHGEANRQETPA